MGVCVEVKRWIEEEVQVPAESTATLVTQSCTEYKQRIEKDVRQPIEQWVSRQERECKKRPWYDPRRWLCTIVNVLVKVVTWVVVVVVEWVPYLICKVVTNVIKIIVMIVVRVLKFLGTFLVCIFTDPLEALKALRDLWTDLLDILREVVEFLKSFLDDTADLVTAAERLTDSLGCSLGFVGTFLGGLAKWIAGRGREAVQLTYEAINNALNLLLGALSLNWCRAVEGIQGLLADVVRAIAWLVSIPAGGAGGIRDSIRMKELEEMIERRLKTVTDDETLLEKARERIRLGNCPFGLPFTVEPARFYLTSRPTPSNDPRFTPVDLRALHNAGVINLHDMAGLMAACEGIDQLWDKDKNRRRLRTEVVYAGTTTPVTYRDIDLFLSDGPEAVAEFRVYPIPLRVFDRYLKLAQRKGYSLGIELQWTRILEHEWQSISTTDPIGIPDSGAGQSIVFTRLARTGARGDICVVPAFAGFRYAGNISRRGMTGMFPSTVSNVDESGVTFRDSLPEFFFQWVLIHELGHYFGLEHAGHDGFGLIMWTPDEAANLETWTTESVVEFIISGEPQFTPDDAFKAWSWILSYAWRCVFGEDRPPTRPEGPVEPEGPVIL